MRWNKPPLIERGGAIKVAEGIKPYDIAKNSHFFTKKPPSRFEKAVFITFSFCSFFDIAAKDHAAAGHHRRLSHANNAPQRFWQVRLWRL